MRRIRRIPLLLASILIHALGIATISVAQPGARGVARGTDPVAPDVVPKRGELLVNTASPV